MTYRARPETLDLRALAWELEQLERETVTCSACSGGRTVETRCARCAGAGWDGALDERCLRCNGSGVLVSTCERCAGAGSYVPDDKSELRAPNAGRYRELKAIEEHLTRTLAVREDTFTEFARAHAYELGRTDRLSETWPYNHVDWQAAADELRRDFVEFVFDGAVWLAPR